MTQSPTLEAERAAPELAPCPFCAGPAQLVEWTASPVEIKCEACGIVMDGLRDEAIAAWNRRAAPVAEGVELPPLGRSVGDDPKFHDLLLRYGEACAKYPFPDPNEIASKERSLIAYIDGRTAGVAKNCRSTKNVQAMQDHDHSEGGHVD